MGAAESAPAEQKELVERLRTAFLVCVPAGQLAPCQSHEYPCGLGTCLNASLVCDGRQDCADGSDEGENCSVPCQRSCARLCYPSPKGPVSASSPGPGAFSATLP